MSINKLSEKIPINGLIEIGAGTGAVTKSLIENFNKFKNINEIVVTEISDSAIEILENTFKLYTNINVVKSTYDITFEDKHFDLAIASHVLEHVTNEERFIKEIVRISKFVIFEIPLENSIILKFIEFFRIKFLKTTRIANKTGHINFYNKKSILNLLKKYNLKILQSTEYTVIIPPFFFSNKFQKIYEPLKMILIKILGTRLFGEIFYSHFAVLVR